MASVFLVALVSYSATTISTNVNTAGYASSTVSLNTQGVLWVGGSATTSASHYIGGTASTTELFVQNNVHIGGSATTSGLTIGTSTTRLRNFLFGTCSVGTPSGTLTPGQASSSNCTATGVVPGDMVFVTPRVALEDELVFKGATNTKADLIGIYFQNATTSNITTAAKTWQWMAIRQI